MSDGSDSVRGMCSRTSAGLPLGLGSLNLSTPTMLRRAPSPDYSRADTLTPRGSSHATPPRAIHGAADDGRGGGRGRIVDRAAGGRGMEDEEPGSRPTGTRSFH